MQGARRDQPGDDPVRAEIRSAGSARGRGYREIVPGTPGFTRCVAAETARPAGDGRHVVGVGGGTPVTP